MMCPYCGVEMIPGKIKSNGSAMLFTVRENPVLLWERQEGEVQFSREINPEIEAHHCPACRKVIVDYSSR